MCTVFQNPQYVVQRVSTSTSRPALFLFVDFPGSILTSCYVSPFAVTATAHARIKPGVIQLLKCVTGNGKIDGKPLDTES